MRFTGYVYNLETERDKSFLAEGVYVHNSAHIYNTSSLSRYAKDDAITAYRYLVTEDDRTSDICMDYADMVVPADELRDVPPMHFSCRTVLEPLFAWESVVPSDMSGLEPMQGFGTPFPSGTGLPGVKPISIPTAMPTKPLELPKEWDAQTRSEWKAREKVGEAKVTKWHTDIERYRKSVAPTLRDEANTAIQDIISGARLTHNTDVAHLDGILRDGLIPHKVRSGLGGSADAIVQHEGYMHVGRSNYLAFHNQHLHGSSGALARYGRIEIVFKPDVSDLAFLSENDSFYFSRPVQASDFRLGANHQAGDSLEHLAWQYLEGATNSQVLENADVAWLEIQVPHTISKGQMDFVFIHEGHLPDMRNEEIAQLKRIAKKYEIPVKVGKSWDEAVLL